MQYNAYKYKKIDIMAITQHTKAAVDRQTCITLIYALTILNEHSKKVFFFFLEFGKV